MAATIKHVARLAGVSIATVSRVINGATNVSAETRNRVSNAICHLQFHPNLNARALSRNEHGLDNRYGMRGSTSDHTRTDACFEMQDTRIGFTTPDELISENIRLTQAVRDLSRDLEKWKKLAEWYGSQKTVAHRLTK